jgi:hypothetical protein
MPVKLATTITNISTTHTSCKPTEEQWRRLVPYIDCFGSFYHPHTSSQYAAMLNNDEDEDEEKSEIGSY